MQTADLIHGGLTLREARLVAERLGAEVEAVRRHGELRFRSPGCPPCTVNARLRHRVSPRLVVWLRRLQERKAG